MPLIFEKIVVLAKSFLSNKNINDCESYNDPFFENKLKEYDWDLSYASAAIFCEIVWKMATHPKMDYYRRYDRLFSPSPVACHANFRGSKFFKTGNVPELGSIAFWKKGNTWAGHMGIVTDVSEDRKKFTVIEGKILNGSDGKFIDVQEKPDRIVGLPFKDDKLNLIGFCYPPKIEIE